MVIKCMSFCQCLNYYNKCVNFIHVYRPHTDTYCGLQEPTGLPEGDVEAQQGLEAELLLCFQSAEWPTLSLHLSALQSKCEAKVDGLLKITLGLSYYKLKFFPSLSQIF